MRTIELAGLKARVAGGPPTAQGSPVVILLHGYGAPGDDLISLADEITVPPGTQFIFPHGPVSLEGPIASDANPRAWWPIDMTRLQVALMTGQLDELARQLLPGLKASVAALTALTVAVCNEFDVPMNRVFLGGFSQGAILCLAAALENTWDLGGLLLFSPTLVDADDLGNRARLLKSPVCVLSHGKLDPILPYSATVRLHSMLVECGWSVDWVPFMGGHGIPPSAIAAAGRLIARAVP